MQIDNGKVFDDESDRWITRLEGETDRDALLRNRAERESMPARKSPTRHPAVGVNPYAGALWVIGVAAVVVGFLCSGHASEVLNEYEPDFAVATSFGVLAVALLSAGFMCFIGGIVLSGVWWALENVKSRR